MPCTTTQDRAAVVGFFQACKLGMAQKRKRVVLSMETKLAIFKKIDEGVPTAN